MKGSCPFCSAVLDLASTRAVMTCRGCGNVVEIEVLEPPPAASVLPSPVAAAAVTAEAPPCARHPRNSAVTGCSRCGDFVCVVCATPVEGTVLCVPCFEHKHQNGELLVQQARFTLPSISMVCGVVGNFTTVFCYSGLILGAIAIITGILAVKAIRRRPGLPGEKKAVAGIVFGALAFPVTVGMFFAMRWMFRGKL